MYSEIKDMDLIAKEFKYHEHCRKRFVKLEKKPVASVSKIIIF